MELKKETYNYSSMYFKEVCEDSDETKESTFSVSGQNVKEQYLDVKEDKNVHASKYVEFLDSLPFEIDDLDEDDIEYYDSVIKT